MSFPTMTDDVEIISKLGDEPNEDDGLTAAELKAKFDEAAKLLKAAHNALAAALNAMDAAESLGFESDAISGDNVKDAMENLRSYLLGQMQDVSQGSVADGSISTAKLAPGALHNWVDVSSQITLTPLIGPYEEYIERKNVSKSFWYNPALGIVRFSLLVGLNTTDAAHYIAFKQEGLYLPKMIAGHTAALAVSSGGEGPAEMDAEYEVDTAQDNVTFTFSVNSSVNYTYRVSGWYICDGPGESEEE